MEEAEDMKEKLLKRKYEIAERDRKLKVEKAATEKHVKDCGESGKLKRKR